MNYLAHLHLAEKVHSDLCGNLLGDFIKGEQYRYYPPEVAQGIHMHRAVDSYTDSHEIVLQAKQLFPKELKRFAGIALDMFWDHCLAHHWLDYSQQSLEQFVTYCGESVQDKNNILENLPEAYIRLNSLMWSRQWLLSYQDFSNLERALFNMAQRRPRIAPLADCFDVLEKHYQTLTAMFREFYLQLLEFIQKFSIKLDK